ncbi:O-antigen ligase [uncultured Megasphaera sp.]|jgi:O-antigen ligase|uniref:O-antigen ligase family protein n=1 Tax=uncultured Megasphaera sp. TaxID=165188 RepID=UPI0025F54D03|nr:O-antigen ligase family protein [uncultured Megasphaera sp.]
MLFYSNLLKTKKIQIFILFGYIFFTFSVCSIAGYNIFTGLAILLVLLSFKNCSITIFVPAKDFLYCYGIFFLSLIIASFFSNDVHTFGRTFKYFSWTLPFWIIIILQSLYFSKRTWKYAILMAIIFIASGTLPQINNQGIRVIGYFGQPTLLGTILGIVMPAIWITTIDSLKNKIKGKLSFESAIFVLVSLLGVFVLLLNKTRGAVIGLAIGGIILFLVSYKNGNIYNFTKKKWIASLIILGILCVMSVFSNTMVHRSYDFERILLWKSSYHMWQDYPVFGVGFGNWNKQYPNYISPLAKEPGLTIPHNVLLSFYSETGIIGGTGFLIFTLGTIVILARKIYKYPDNIFYKIAFWSFITITCHGMVDTGLTYRSAVRLMSLILGMAFASENTMISSSVDEVDNGLNK